MDRTIDMMESNTFSAVNTNCTKLKLVVSHDQRLICGIFYLAITVAGILGNGIVIFAVFASKKLQTFTNMFVVNLSVADLLSCLMMQLQCVMMLSPDGVEYPLSKDFCAFVAGALCVACGCSLYTLASIGFYRYVLLTDKSRTRADTLQTKLVAVPWIGLTWIVPMVVNLVTHAFAREQFGYNEKYHVCGAQDETGMNHEIEIAQVFGLYSVAFIIVVISYLKIYVYIHKHTLNTLRELDNESQFSPTRWRTLSIKSWTSTTNRKRTASTMSNSSQTENARQLYRRQITITKNMFYVVLAFTICITPYSVCLIFPQLNGLLYSGVLLMFNSCINPMLYGLKHPHFRQVFKCLLTCQWSRVPKPSNAFKKIRTLCKFRKDDMQKYEERIML
ncbi:alpha-1D adrenergic receptor-like [Amphiura filiformis]|uniref:alpha-1D adrenergic receptor-like n=1 Tax=Amphiura filiformis TaxID=82378 RepID=UPI003B2113D7